MNEQQKYFELLSSVCAIPLQIANIYFNTKTQTFTPGRRTNPQDSEVHDERQVSINEVVFDFDYGSYSMNYRIAKRVVDVLLEMNIEPIICATGGKGIHIHVFFDKINLSSKENKDIFVEAFSYGFNWKRIRLWFWNHVLDEAGVDVQQRGAGKKIDSLPISFNYYAGTTHLIRDIGGRKKFKHKDTEEFVTTYKTYIPLEEFNKKKITITEFNNVRYPTNIKTFQLNENELIFHIQEYLKQQKQITEPLKNQKLHIPYLQLASVQQILEGMPTGKRSQGAMIVSIACKIDRLSKEESTNILKQYVENCSSIGHKFHLGEAESWRDWIYNQEAVYWNCSQLKDLEVHDIETCDFCQSKNKEALQLLKSSNMVTKVKSLLDKTIVGEDDTKMLMFLLMLSKDFPSKTGTPGWNIESDPQSQNIILASDSSSGKTYVAKQILKLFGEEGIDYFIVSRISKSVLNYYTEINMDGKVFFIEELQGLDENTSQLRVWMSEGSLSFDSVEKVMVDGLEKNVKVTKRTKGQPCFVSCQAEGVIEEQFNNRSWILSMNVSSEQTKNILDYQDNLNLGVIESFETEKRVVKDALKQLKPYHFKIPFLKHEYLGIPVDDIRTRRDYQKFLTLIKCITYLHQKQRVVEVDTNGREFLISDIVDYDMAVEYAHGVLGATFSGLTIQQIDIINLAKKQPLWADGFQISDLQRLKGKSQTHWYGQLQQLEDLGYLTSERKYGTANLYFLNKERAYKIINLPTGNELLKMGDLNLNKNVMGNSPNLETAENPVTLETMFRSSSGSRREIDSSNLNINPKCNNIVFSQVDESKNIGMSPKKNYVDDIRNFIKNYEKHTVPKTVIYTHFDDLEEIDKAIEYLLKTGEIMNIRNQEVMLI